MLVRCAVHRNLSILCQTHISKALMRLLSSTFNVYVSAVYRKTNRTSDCISLFLIFLKILLSHVTLRSLVIADLIRAIQRRISANEPPSALMMEHKYTQALTFPRSLRAVETGRHLALSTTMTFVFDALILSSSFSLAIFTRLTRSAIHLHPIQSKWYYLHIAD